MAPCDGNEFGRRLLHDTGPNPDAKGNPRGNFEHRFNLGPARIDLAGGLWHIQGRRCAFDQAAGL